MIRPASRDTIGTLGTKKSCEKSISIIFQNPEQFIDPDSELLSDFEVKTLDARYLDDIVDLISGHYIEDTNGVIRLLYPKDFIYWYLKYVPAGFFIGLTYNKKLVGIISAIFIDMIIYNEKMKIPYIDLLCIQKKIRKLGLAGILVNELKKRLVSIGIVYSLFTTMNNLPNNFCSTRDFMIPINYSKLNKIGFILDDDIQTNLCKENPLSVMVKSDISIVTTKLNDKLKDLVIKPFLTNESTRHFLLPKNNIVYTFVIRNSEGDVTDMISVYKHYILAIESHLMISNAQLSFYFNESRTLTQLVELLLDKLKNYGFDQLTYRDQFTNTDINITHYDTNGQLNYYAANISIPKTSPKDICFLPF